MSLLNPDERPAAETLSRLAYCNPFLAERIELERRLLGERFRTTDAVWHARGSTAGDNPNLEPISERAGELLAELRGRLIAGATPDDEERRLYQDLAIYVLYDRHEDRLHRRIVAPGPSPGDGFEFYDTFREEAGRLFELPGVGYPSGLDAVHLFACFFQVRRAFHYIFRSIAGSSMPSARLRAQVWQSVLTRDLRRFQRSLFDRMGSFATMITGPSGAGKELVARAIGLSRYIPFDPRRRRFREDYEGSFFPLNLTALSPTLIESELFGHRRGAFTGAIEDRKGWLEVCPPLGTVFLDEIGEVEASIQVKLLRVLETRKFQSLGSTEERPFHGKVVAATNRDLVREMREGRFRDDLYYRLCSDTIEVPSLASRIADSPAELEELVEVLAHRAAGVDEAPELAAEVLQWIGANLDSGYAWPGNVRELSQCVSNVLIRGDYRPVPTTPAGDPRERLAAAFVEGKLSADELLERYCTLVYHREGSYVAAAERLGIDRRTVKAHIDSALLGELRGD